MMSEQQTRVLSELNRQMTEEVARLEVAWNNKNQEAVEKSKVLILQLQQKFSELMS